MSKDEMKSKAEQMETLEKVVNPSGVGEDPAIKALVSDEFIKMDDEEALSVAIAVAKIVRGQLQEELNGTMTQLKQVMMEMQETARKSEEDRLKFAQEIFDKAEKLRKVDNDQIAVQSMDLWDKARKEAKAAAMIRRAEIDDMVQRAPKIKMMHPGVPQTVRIGGNKQTIMKPFEIRYEHLAFIFPPNEPIEIPDFIYKAFMKEQEMAKERDGLKEALVGARNHFGKAIQAEPAVDPNYARRISEGLGPQQNIIVPKEVENGE